MARAVPITIVNSLAPLSSPPAATQTATLNAHHQVMSERGKNGEPAARVAQKLRAKKLQAVGIVLASIVFIVGAIMIIFSQTVRGTPSKEVATLVGGYLVDWEMVSNSTSASTTAATVATAATAVAKNATGGSTGGGTGEESDGGGAEVYECIVTYTRKNSDDPVERYPQK